MKEQLLEKSRFDGMKYAQYEDIPVVKDMCCPECLESEVSGYPSMAEATPVGWCETSSGFMGIFECPICFAKFRCHIDSTGRYHEESFYEDFALLHYLHYRREEETK